MSTVTTESLKTETIQHTVPVVAEVENTNVKPKVRRVIDEEGGTTTALVQYIILLTLLASSLLIVSSLPPNMESWGEVPTT
jgi:hypothetical protein